MEFDRIDHVVFTVRDVEATCAWYARVLGLEVVTFNGGRRALQVGHCKINLHQAGHEFEPKAAQPAPGTQDICLITTGPIADVVAHLHSAGVDILEAPGTKTGATGIIESVYLRDPDGNLIEVAQYADASPSVTPAVSPRR